MDITLLDAGCTSDAVVRKFLRENLNGSIGMKNRVIEALSEHLWYYNKTALKTLVRLVEGPARKNLESKTHFVIGDRTLENFDIITLKQSRRMMVFRGNSYTFDLAEVEKFISDCIKEFDVSHRHYFAEVHSYIEKQTLFDETNLIFDPHYIPFRNGSLVLYRGKGRGYIADFVKPDRDLKFFYQIPHEFRADKRYRCPKFKQALRQWLTSEKDPFPTMKVRDVFEAIGLCMSTNMKFKTAFLNYGPAHTGKTQFFNVVRYVIGEENMSFTSLQRLGKDQFGGARLAYKLLNYCGDIPSTKIKDNGLFKTITGGDVAVEGEKKFKPEFNFRPTNKFWFNANRIPRFADWKDEAAYERFILIPFLNPFKEAEEDTTQDFWKGIVQDPSEVQGIIHESIRGYMRLLERGYFRPSLKGNTAHIWNYESDDYYAFIYDYCERDPKGKIKVDDFVDAFTEIYPGYVKNSITINLGKMGIRKKELTDREASSKGNRKKARYYVGIKWKDDEFFGEELEELKDLGLFDVLRESK